MKVIAQFHAPAALPLGTDPGASPDVGEETNIFPFLGFESWTVHFVANHCTYCAISAHTIKSNIQLQYAFLYDTRCIKQYQYDSILSIL
jgi:hypothetical protein